jgi:hypothetical protein
MNKFIVAVIASSLIFISCKKENCPAPETPSVVGFWKGKWGFNADYPSNGYAALFRSNGTVRIFDGADTTTATKAEGTYSVSGTTVTATYTYTGSSSPLAISATADAKFTFLEGTWGTSPSSINGGKWLLNKK